MALGKGIPVINGFDLNSKLPLDSRTVADTKENMNALVTNGSVGDGQLCYCKADKKLYVLKEGAWSEVGGSGGGKLEGFTIDVSNTYNPETKEFSATLTDEQWTKVKNEQIYWIGVTYINNQETGEEASTTLLYEGPFFGESRIFGGGDGIVMFIYDKSVEGTIIKATLTIDTQGTPTSQLIPSITTSNTQQNLTIGDGLEISNGVLKATGSGGGGKSVPPTLNLVDLEAGEVRTTITEEEKTNLENGLYNQVIFPGLITDELQLFMPAKLIGDKSIGINTFAQFNYVIGGDGPVITALSIYGYSFGEKDTNGNYPITITKRFDMPVGDSGGGSGVTVTFED